MLPIMRETSWQNLHGCLPRLDMVQDPFHAILAFIIQYWQVRLSCSSAVRWQSIEKGWMLCCSLTSIPTIRLCQNYSRQKLNTNSYQRKSICFKHKIKVYALFVTWFCLAQSIFVFSVLLNSCLKQKCHYYGIKWNCCISLVDSHFQCQKEAIKSRAWETKCIVYFCFKW